MSFKPEVIADDSGQWSTNSLRFATREEAEANVLHLAMRWLAVREWRATECDDPVTHRWTDRGLLTIDAPEGTEPYMPPQRVQL
jgi:hypothetical protein